MESQEFKQYIKNVYDAYTCMEDFFVILVNINKLDTNELKKIFTSDFIQALFNNLEAMNIQCSKLNIMSGSPMELYSEILNHFNKLNQILYNIFTDTLSVKASPPQTIIIFDDLLLFDINTLKLNTSPIIDKYYEKFYFKYNQLDKILKIL